MTILARGAVVFASDWGFSAGAYDLEGWRLESLPDDPPILDLRLGLGYEIFALATLTRPQARWRLMIIDCAVYEVDEIEVRVDHASFDCKQVSLPVFDGDVVRLGGPDARPERLLSATFWANEAGACELRLGLEGGGALTWAEGQGWRLAQGGEQSAVQALTVMIDHTHVSEAPP